MKQLLKAWKDYKESLKPYTIGTSWTSVSAMTTFSDSFQTTPLASFEGFMDYLVSKEKPKKRKVEKRKKK